MRKDIEFKTNDGVTLRGGHFDAYTGDDFKLNSATQRDWFIQHLKP